MRANRAHGPTNPKTASPSAAVEHINRLEHVRRQLESAIRKGEYRLGDRLPSERELAQLLEVSRVSVRVAVALVEVQQGRESFVASGTGKYYVETLRAWLEAHRNEVVDTLERLDIRFHESLAQAASNALLSDLLDALNHHLSTSRKNPPSVSSRPPIDAPR